MGVSLYNKHEISPVCNAVVLAAEDVLHITNPEKKALIHDIIRVCGIIIAIFPFIIPIIASIPAGSVIGFGAPTPRFSGSFKKAPVL